MRFLHKKAPVGRQRLPGGVEREGPKLAYYSRRSDQELNTGRKLQRAVQLRAAKSLKRFWVQRFGLVILLAVVLISVCNMLSLSTNAKVIPLGSTGTGSFLHDQATYQAAASKLLAKSFWNHNKITVDTATITREMMRQFPELSNVSITLPLLAHRPIVYLEPAQPALILVASNGSFVLDTTGKALLSSPAVAAFAGLNLPVVTDQSGLKPVLEHVALASNAISFIRIVVAQLTAKQFAVSSLTLPPAASELDVHLSGQSYFIKFNLQGSDARQQAGTFLATAARLSTQNITPTQYIDVRVDGRAYYQ